ncbi:hypothetical protein [Bradyrhizobium sp. RT10b]|uniref:hypothetical protein n=1 Tax=unclassified Bradyrhizobium TaxID=2631580 RepID=UPI00339244B3
MSDNDKDFNRLRAQFSRRANAPEIPPLASKLCWWIAFGRMDTKRRSAFVTQITLANDLGGVSVRSVQRMIDVLKPLGLKVAPGHGPDKASTYWIGEANTTSMSPIQPGQGDTGVGSTRHSATEKATLVSCHIKNSKKNSKKVSNKSPAVPAAGRTTDADRESATTNSATIDDETPNQRASHEALAETVTAKQQPPSATSIGTAAHGTHAGPGFDAVCRSARELFGAKGDAVATRLLAALGDDVEDALDTLAVAADEADPMNYLKLEVERQRPRENDAENPWRTNDD